MWHRDGLVQVSQRHCFPYQYGRLDAYLLYSDLGAFAEIEIHIENL